MIYRTDGRQIDTFYPSVRDLRMLHQGTKTRNPPFNLGQDCSRGTEAQRVGRWAQPRYL